MDGWLFFLLEIRRNVSFSSFSRINLTFCGYPLATVEETLAVLQRLIHSQEDSRDCMLSIVLYRSRTHLERAEQFFFTDQTDIIEGQQASHTEEKAICVSLVRQVDTEEETERKQSLHAACQEVMAEICTGLHHAERLCSVHFTTGQFYFTHREQCLVSQWGVGVYLNF